MIKFSQKNLRIETERLILRQPAKQDVADVIKNLNNLDVSRWLSVVPFPYTEKDALWYIDHTQEKANVKPRKDYGYWIELKESGEVIGGIGLSDIKEETGIGTIGYWLGIAHHRKGYGSEALEAVITLAFRKLRLRRLEAGVFTGNPSSGVLLEKFCFKLEGMKRQAMKCKADGIIKDEYIYGLLNSEYKYGRR